MTQREQELENEVQRLHREISSLSRWLMLVSAVLVGISIEQLVSIFSR